MQPSLLQQSHMTCVSALWWFKNATSPKRNVHLWKKCSTLQCIINATKTMILFLVNKIWPKGKHEAVERHCEADFLIYKKTPLIWQWYQWRHPTRSIFKVHFTHGRYNTSDTKQYHRIKIAERRSEKREREIEEEEKREREGWILDESKQEGGEKGRMIIS